MRLRAEELARHLAGARLAPIYVVHGDEPLLALEAAEAVRQAARTAGCRERTVLVAERGFDWSELAHAGATGTLFGGGRLIELRLPRGAPEAPGAEAICRHAARPAAGHVTLVLVPRLARREQQAPWFAALEAAGVVVDVYPLARARLPDWIGARLAAQGQRASAEALAFLAARVEGNLLAAHQEIAKLALLAPPGELDAETVRAAVADSARYDALEAAAALAARDLARYARVLTGLRAEGEPLPRLVWTLADGLLAARRAQPHARDPRALETHLREAGVWADRLAVVRELARRLAAHELDRMILALARIDRAAKGVGSGEPWQALLALALESIGATDRPRPER